MRKHFEIHSPERGNDRARSWNCGLRESEGAGALDQQGAAGDRSHSPVFSEEGGWEESS